LIALAVIAGVGGGGIMVPIMLAFFKMDTRNAIACSNFVIVTTSVTRYFTTCSERHSEKDATCIEYSLANLMLPTVLLGSIMGVWFNIAMPELVT
jgi:uncharacterized membrane protein YfcA